MLEKAKAEVAWSEIVSFLERQEGHSYEFQTVKLNGEGGLWFLAALDGGSIVVNPAREHEPSSDVKVNRPITGDKFTEAYPFYEKWITGVIKRSEIIGGRYNLSYIFALIAYFRDNEHKG
jgi:hypothetical protein